VCWKKASQILADGNALYRYSQLYRVVRRMNQILLGAEIPLRRLNRGVTQQQLDLLKLPATGAA